MTRHHQEQMTRNLDKSPMVITRAEQSGDEAAIRRVNQIAFDRPEEANLVDALRGSEAWLSELSLVAEDDSGIVGHALFSVVDLNGGVELLSLGPMAVVSHRQRTGVGKALVMHGLKSARQTTYPLVVVLGHPGYYPRFGFEPARGSGSTRLTTCPTKLGWPCGSLPTMRKDPAALCGIRRLGRCVTDGRAAGPTRRTRCAGPR
jgi:putative acetyltransferase